MSLGVIPVWAKKLPVMIPLLMEKDVVLWWSVEDLQAWKLP